MIQNNLAKGLVAYYPFNGNAIDETGNKHDGQVQNAILIEDRFGNPNSAYNFNGKDSYINISNAADLSFSNSFSVSFWIKAGKNNREEWTTVMDKSHQYGNPYPYYDWVIEQDLSQPNTLKLTCGFRQPGYYLYSKNSTYEIDQWIHYVFIKNDSLETTYRNGQWLNEINQQYWEININPASPLIIGANNHPDKIDRFFNGTIDDIYIFDRSLNSDEVTILYSMTPTAFPTVYPTTIPSFRPTELPISPSQNPTETPTMLPTWRPTSMPIKQKDIIETKISSRNSKINNHQTACLIDNLALVVWQGQDKDGTKIYAKILDLNGMQRNIFQVDSGIDNNYQTNPVSSKLSNTSCLIAWINNKVDILGVIVNLIDNKIGNQFFIKSDIQLCKSGPISLSATNFGDIGYVLSWSEAKNQYCSTITELFYNNGIRMLLPNDVNALSDFYNPHVASFGEAIVVTDIESRHSSSNSNVHARIYDGNLGPVHSHYIDIFDISNEGIPISYNQRFLAISTIFENIITFIWENKKSGNWQLYKKMYNTDGLSLSEEIQIISGFKHQEYNNINPSAISFKFKATIFNCITWHKYNNNDDKSIGVYLQCFDYQNKILFKETLKLNHQFTGNSFSTNNYDSSFIFLNEQKQFAVLFSELTNTNNHLDVYLQLFDRDGHKVPYPEESPIMESVPDSVSTESISPYGIELIFIGFAITGLIASFALYNYYYHGSKGGVYEQIAEHA